MAVIGFADSMLATARLDVHHKNSFGYLRRLHNGNAICLLCGALYVHGRRFHRDSKFRRRLSSTTHVNFKSSKSFDVVTAAIEKQLGKFDAPVFGATMKDVSNPAEVEAKIHAMEGTSGFMLFAVRDHGQLLSLKGRKAFDRQYEIGNPLIAVEMTQSDLRAGEYAPLRICRWK